MTADRTRSATVVLRGRGESAPRHLWVPKPVSPGRMRCLPLVTRPRVRHLRVRSWPAGAWDDLRLVGLKLIFVIVTRAVSLLGFSRREWWWKDAEILMLRHQLAVAERERPRAHSRLTCPDRGVACTAGRDAADRPSRRDAADRYAGHHLAVAPGHRPPPVVAPVAGGPVRAPGNAPEGPRCCGLPGRTSRGVTAASTANWQGSASPWRRPRSGRS
jgi:hypothetical protein